MVTATIRLKIKSVSYTHLDVYKRQVFEFQYGRKILDAFHLLKIPADEIILSPELLK